MRAEHADEAAADTNTNARAHAAQENNGTAVQEDTAQTAQIIAAATQAVPAGALQPEGETHSPTSTTTNFHVNPAPASPPPDPAAVAARLEARRAAVERRKWLKSMLPLMEQRIAELEVQAASIAKKKKRSSQSAAEDECDQIVCSLGTKNEFSALVCPSIINNTSFDCSLLDSGATLSCISAAILPRLHLTTDDLMPWSSGRVKGAGGANLSILGSLWSMFSVGGGTPVAVRFIVVENLSHDVIIGLDALNAVGASLSFKNGNAVFKPEGALHATTIRVAKSRALRMATDVRIEPRTAAIISAVCESPWSADAPTYLCEPDTDFLSDERRSNLHIARSIFSAESIIPSDIPLRVVNTANTPVYFRRGDIVAHLSQLDDSEVASVASIEFSNFNNLVADDAGDDDIPEPPRPVSHAEMTARLDKLVDAHQSLSDASREKLRALLHEYPDVFAQNSKAPAAAHSIHHSIDTGTHAPTRQRPRPMNPAMTKIINDQVSEMLENGIIRPSTSAWASPVVLVKKRDSSIRFCMDFRKLNAITSRDSFPLPNMTATLDSLHNGKILQRPGHGKRVLAGSNGRGQHRQNRVCDSERHF
jgi:hypothetical protein